MACPGITASRKFKPAGRESSSSRRGERRKLIVCTVHIENWLAALAENLSKIIDAGEAHRRADRNHTTDTSIRTSDTQGDGRTEREACDDDLLSHRLVIEQVIKCDLSVIGFALRIVIASSTLAHTAVVEAQYGIAGLLQRLCGPKDYLVVHGAAELGVRVKDDRDARRLILPRPVDCLEVAVGSWYQEISLRIHYGFLRNEKNFQHPGTGSFGHRGDPILEGVLSLDHGSTSTSSRSERFESRSKPAARDPTSVTSLTTIADVDCRLPAKSDFKTIVPFARVAVRASAEGEPLASTTTSKAPMPACRPATLTASTPRSCEFQFLIVFADQIRWLRLRRARAINAELAIAMTAM